MHILVTNDDGPPSTSASPYILAFVNALEAAGHTVSVVIPDCQRSWIGKAHIVGQDVRAVAYWPPESIPDVHPTVDDATSRTQRPPVANVTDANATTNNDADKEKTDNAHPWILVNSTPATCAQLGLGRHFFSNRGPIDLVISGPNYGRNTTSVFALSSGTLGGAMEATACGYASIALSFAFFDRTNAADVVKECAAHAVRVCEWLATNASFDGGRLYSVNVPVKPGVTSQKVRWTRMLQNQWKEGACFQEQKGSTTSDPDAAEVRIRRRESDAGGVDDSAPNSGFQTPARDAGEGEWRTRHFKWSPRFTDVYESVEKAGPGSDGWTVKAGETSITALRANFMHVDGPGVEGEVKL